MTIGNVNQGMVSSTVLPNNKCTGCLHFEGQSGQYGLCYVGLQPVTCGDGSYPLMGYAPIAHQMPTLPDDTLPAMPATETVGEVDGLGHYASDPSKLENLGDSEHLMHLFKSVLGEAVASVRSQCAVHQQAGNLIGHMLYRSGGHAACNCVVLKSGEVAAAFMSRLPRRAQVLAKAEALAFAEKAFDELYDPPLYEAVTRGTIVAGSEQEVVNILEDEFEDVQKAFDELAGMQKSNSVPTAGKDVGADLSSKIGTTRSGKDIYARERPRGEDWTAQDHSDASDAHKERADRAKQKTSEALAAGEDGRAARHQKKFDDHSKMWKWHASIARSGG